jgi:hypothetical protein
MLLRSSSGQRPSSCGRSWLQPIGSAPYITIVFLSQLIGVEPTMVSYRGLGQTINDILSGSIDGSCDLVATISGHVQSGSLKALVVAGDERLPVVPDVPTASEASLPECRNLDRSRRAQGYTPDGACETFRGDRQNFWPTPRAPSGSLASVPVRRNRSAKAGFTCRSLWSARSIGGAIYASV